MLVFKKKETKTCRGLEFRIDAFGIYFLASEKEDLVAGFSYQYPAWFSELFAEPKEYYVRNSFSYFNWRPLTVINGACFCIPEGQKCLW